MRKNQNGMVSILVATVLMVVMSLITLGFARITQREQRQSLDEQLSTQAFYAAESGINVVKSMITSGANIVEKAECDVSSDPIYNNGEVDVTSEAYFTCVLIDPSPQSLIFNNDSISSTPEVVSFTVLSDVDRIKIEWADSSNSTTFDGTCNIYRTTPVADWGNNMPLLKLDIIPIPAAPFTRQSLAASAFSTVLYPCGSAPSGALSLSYGDFIGANLGRHFAADCQSPADGYDCEVTITDTPASQEYYIVMRSIYNNLNARITAYDNVGTALLLGGSQAVVDVTGRSNDVYRRLQARIPLKDSYLYPSAVLQTRDDLCKRYEIGVSTLIDSCLD